MAGPLSRGGGAKGPAIKKKLGTLFSILSAMQNKIYLYIIPKYGRITLNLESFYWLIKKFAKNMAPLVQK